MRTRTINDSYSWLPDEISLEAAVTTKAKSSADLVTSRLNEILRND